MKSCMSFTKGLGMGIVVGMAAAVTVKCVCSNNKKLCKRTGKAARTVSQVLENIQELLE